MKDSLPSIPSRRKNKLVLLGYSFALIVFVTFAVGFSNLLALGPVSTYTGCLKSGSGSFSGAIYNLKEGSSPFATCASGDDEISLGSGDITAVTAGTGLTGGATSGEATLEIGESYQLPQDCDTDEIIKWNGTVWECAELETPPAIVTKDAIVGGGNTQTTTSSTPTSLSGTTVSFSSGDIPVDSKLIISWTGRFNNSTAGLGSGIQTHVLVDSTEVVGTHINSALSGGWTQHAANKVVDVTAGAHDVSVTWNVFGTGQSGTGTSADTQMVVTVIPNP